MQVFGDKISKFTGNMKLNKEISDLEMKKQSLIRSIQNEADGLNTQISNKFWEIGSLMYEQHVSGSDSVESFTGKFDEITGLRNTINDKLAKIKEISDRYDEEITLLKNLNPAPAYPQQPMQQPMQQQAAAPAEPIDPNAPRCKSCGTPFRLNVDAFCKNCGNKLA